MFRGRHFEDRIIVLCVRWYLRYSLSYRDLEETPGLAKLLYTLARAIAGRRKFSEAEPLYERALSVLEPSGEAEQLTIAAVLNHLGMLFHESGREAEAVASRLTVVLEMNNLIWLLR